MGKKKHKKKRKDKKQSHTSLLGSRLPIINGTPYPVYSWGSWMNAFDPMSTPFLDRLPITKPPSKPLTDKDMEAATQAADQIVREHKK